MGKEIEHKFLLANDDWRQHIERSEEYSQGYLATNERCSIRVRVAADRAWLNMKSATLGISRTEFEFHIPVEEARQILESLCIKPYISKTRHFVKYGLHTWEIDEFHADNDGLIVAEIELQSEDEDFLRPDWIGEDVSADTRYYNACLVQNPYKNW